MGLMACFRSKVFSLLFEVLDFYLDNAHALRHLLRHTELNFDAVTSC